MPPSAPEIDVVRAAAGRPSDALDDAIADVEAQDPLGADAFAGLQLVLATDGSAALPLLQLANPRRAAAIEEALVRVSTDVRRVQARNGDAGRRAEFAAARRDAVFDARVAVDDLCDAFATARDTLNDAVLELPDRLALRTTRAAPRAAAAAAATGSTEATSIAQHLVIGWTELTKAAKRVASGTTRAGR